MFQVLSNTIKSSYGPCLHANYATAPAILGIGKALKKKVGKGGALMEKKVFPVETDAHKLVKYLCGSNILQEGGQDVELKPDSEYPDWLWNIHIGPPKKLEELDPNTKEYWWKVRKLAIVRNHKLRKIRKF